jgi:predicted RNase H-like nuclease (RuvC/YqgF family)
MGSCTSHDDAVLTLSDNVKKLQNELQSIKDLDKNKDGIVTKDEQKEQHSKMQMLEERIEKELSQKYQKVIQEKEHALLEAKATIDELNKQLTASKNICTNLETKLSKGTQHEQIEQKVHLQTLSRERVDEFVEKLLEDESVNMSYLPDFIERQMYKNVLNLVIGLLNNTLNTATLNVIGHQLSFAIKPLDEKLDVKL